MPVEDIINPTDDRSLISDRMVFMLRIILSIVRRASKSMDDPGLSPTS